MAYSTTTIDVIGRFVDNISSGAKKATRSIDETGKAAEKTGKRLDEVGRKKPRPKVDPDTSNANRKLDATERMLKKLEKSKVKMVIDAVDHASDKFRKIEDRARSIVGKTWETVVKIKDLATSPLRAIHNALFNIKTLIGVITAGFAAQKFIAAPIALADQYASARIGFSTLLGDKRGQQMMNDLDKFAKATPFNTTQVIAQAQKMIAMGWDAEQILTDMQTIGDAAAATGKGEEGLGRIVLALSQIKSKGKLSTEELNQLAESGISAKRYIAQGLGYGSGDEGLMKMTKDLEKGAIGAEAGIAAIIEGMKEYQGMMNKTANETMSGIRSQIGDTFEIAIFRRWGQGLQDGAKKGFGSVLELLDSSEAGLKKVGDLLFDLGSNISNWFANRMKAAVEIATALTETEEFKNAGLGGKIKILWDGIVADPIKEWWNGGGEQKAAATMGKIGSWLGKTISNILIGALNGTDALNGGGPESVGEKTGSSIAESFVRGFLENFDGGAITEAFTRAVKNIWNAMPGWAKLIIGGIGVSKATQGLSGLFGLGSAVAGGVRGIGAAGSKFIGTTGNAVAGASGFLGWLANMGYDRKLGRGWNMKAMKDPTFAARAMSIGGKEAALAGILPALGIAGGVVGGATAISGGIDLVRGYRNNDDTLKKAGGWKVGGAAGGAALGAALGSVIPGLGTLVGAGIGAGVGGVAGWWQSNRVKKAALEKESLAELETIAESDSELAQKAAEEIVRRNKMVTESIKKQFGTVEASLEEIEALAAAITMGDKAEQMGAFAQAAEEAKNRMTVLTNAAEQLNKWNWKASINAAAGHKMTDEQKQGYLGAVEAFIKSAEEAIEAKHYEVTAAVNLLLDPESRHSGAIITQTDAFYSKIQEELNGYTAELNTKIELALDDGLINESEAKVIEELQNKIAEITNKVSKAENEAKLEAIKIKFSSGQLDYDSFTKLQGELQTQVESATDKYDTALTTSITSLKLQLAEGAITPEDYDEQIKALTEGYNANIGELKASVDDIQLEILSGAFDITKTRMKTALEESISQGIDPINWSQDQAKEFLGVSVLDEQTALALGQMLSTMADKEEIAAAAKTAGDGIAEKLTPSDGALSKMATDTRTNATTQLQNAFANPINVEAKLNFQTSVTGLPTGAKLTGNPFSQARGGIIYPSGLKSFGAGGMVRGGGQLVRVAEEGTPEMIIPLGSQRRNRGLTLWEKAGHMLGIPGFATGGLVGGQDEGLRFRDGDTMESGIESGQSVQIEVGGITVEINVDGSETGNIAEAIRAQANEIAETVAGIMADAFTAQFENTPARGGAI